MLYSKHEKKINHQMFIEVPSFSAHSSAKFIGKSVQILGQFSSILNTFKVNVFWEGNTNFKESTTYFDIP